MDARDVEREAIPRDQALAICEEIIQENRGKWYTSNGLWCWGCLKFSKSVDGRCFANAEGNRGCGQVNRRFDGLSQA